MCAVAVCYFIAFLLELYRFVRRNHWGTFPAALGFVLHTFFVYQQHIIAAHPLGATAMLFLASAWGLVLIYFLWTFYYPNIPFGAIVLPLALLLIGGSFWSSSAFEPSGLSLHSAAKMLHVASAAGFVIALLTGGICRLLYSFEVYLLRKKRSLILPIKLPSLEWSLSAFRVSMVVAIFCFCLCLLTLVIMLISNNELSKPPSIDCVSVFIHQCCVSSV